MPQYLSTESRSNANEKQNKCCAKKTQKEKTFRLFLLDMLDPCPFGNRHITCFGRTGALPI